MQVSFRIATILLIAVPQVTWSEDKSRDRATALDILAQARQISDSLSRVNRDRILVKIATAQAKAGDLQTALTTAKEIGDLHHRQTAIVDTASFLVKGGKRTAGSKVLDQFVEELIREQRDQSRIASSLRDIATAQVRFDDVLAARETCRKTLRIIDGIKIPQQSDVALRDIAFVQSTAKDADAARQTAQTIENKGRRNEAFAGIASRQAALGAWQKALQTVNSVDDGSVIPPLIAIASAQAKSGAMQEVDETIQVIKSKVEKPKYASEVVDVASMAIAVAQFERGDDKGAFERLNSVSDPRIKSKALASIAKIQEKNGDLKGALETLRSAIPNSWNSSIIARLQAKTSDTIGALQTAETITDSFRRAWAYIYIAKSQPTTGDNASAAAILEKASKAAKSVNRQNRVAVMRFIAVAYAETGNYSAAVKTAQAMDPRHRSGPLFEIAKAQSKAGEVAGALALAKETSSAVEKSYALIGAAEGLLE